MQRMEASWLTSAASQQVLAAIKAAGGEMRFVGGCVRDALLGRKVFDMDAACTLPPEKTMQALEAAGIRAIPTGIDHGTITGICQSQHYEITTLRRDVACDGRHAEVAFTDDWREDAARRDFTMNALYVDGEGKIYDYYGGAADAAAGRVRFIGDAAQRIEEDALRILRFFRFFAHYGQGMPDAEGVAACKALATRMTALSGERIHTEMFKLLRAPAPQKVLAVMTEQGIHMPISLPPLGDAPLAELVQYEPQPDALRRLALLLRHQPALLEPLLQRWKCSNADKARLRTLVAEPPAVVQWDEAQQKRHIRAKGAELFMDEVLLAWAEQPQQAEKFRGMLALAESWKPAVFPLTGHDVMALGVQEGKQIGALLNALENWWEEAHYQPDKTALLHEARRRLAD